MTTEPRTSIAKVNLKDEDNFPILGKANGKNESSFQGFIINNIYL